MHVQPLIQRKPKLILIASLAAGLLAAATLGAQSRSPIDVSRLGPQVGEAVPDFTLRDQNGAPRTLQSVMGQRGAMIVFIRSADW
jgi:cytochrome oxidase Cu insertion factor (SCO1/SenC/PrrC family)